MSDKYLIVGDIHIDSKPPASREDGFTEAIFDKLRQINEIASEKDVDAILQLGDIFHRVSIPTYFLSKLVKFFYRSDKQWYSIAGNHSLRWGKVSEMDNSPISILFQSGVVKNFVECKDEVNSEQVEFYPYHFTSDWHDPSIIIDEPDQTSVLFVHQFHEPQFGDRSETVSDEFISKFDIAFFGHDHRKISTQVNGTEVVLPGAISRLTSEWADMNRDVSVKYFEVDKDGYHLEDIELDIEPIDEVYNEQKLEKKKRDKSIQEFVQEIERKGQKSHNDEIKEILDTLVDDPDILSLCNEYLTEHQLV